MNKHLRKIVCVVMVLVLAFSLSACSADPNCGNYVCKTIQVSGESTGDITVDVNQVFKNGGASIELKEAGACDLILDGVKYEGSWKSDGSKINIKIEDDDIYTMYDLNLDLGANYAPKGVVRIHYVQSK